MSDFDYTRSLVKIHANKKQAGKSRAAASDLYGKQGNSNSNMRFVDNRSEAVLQRKLKAMDNAHPQVQGINNDVGIEKQADVKDSKAAQMHHTKTSVLDSCAHAPLQMFPIKKFKVDNWDALTKLGIVGKSFDTDNLDTEMIRKLIVVLEQDARFSKRPEMAKLRALAPVDKPTAPVGSKNPIVAAIARRFEGLTFSGDKPDLVFVDPKELTTTAAYDVESHTIKANNGTRDEAKLWDNILFEAQNARNEANFKAASRNKGGGSEKTFSEYGEEYASIEYDSFIKYYQELLEIEKEIGGRKKLPEQAQKALARGDAYSKMSEIKARQEFIGSPHKKGAAGKAGLSSADLYAYESIESSDHKTIASRLTNVARPLYASMGGLTQDPAQTLRSSYGNFKWPPEKALRPHALQLMLAYAQNAASDLKKTYGDKAKLLDSFIASMEQMKLSGPAQKLAKDVYRK